MNLVLQVASSHSSGICGGFSAIYGSFLSFSFVLFGFPGTLVTWLITSLILRLVPSTMNVSALTGTTANSPSVFGGELVCGFPARLTASSGCLNGKSIMRNEPHGYASVSCLKLYGYFLNRAWTVSMQWSAQIGCFVRPCWKHAWKIAYLLLSKLWLVSTARALTRNL